MRWVCLFLGTLLFCACGDAHNITKILNGIPDCSEFNKYLTQTKLADEINSRTTITVLVLNNAAMADITSKNLGLAAIKNILSLHVLLDYFDGQKLHDINNGSALSTTLYQTTGNAEGNSGFLNITDIKGGKVGFGAVTPGSKSKLDSTFVKSLKEVPYNISVLEISKAIMPSDLAAPAPSANLNITELLEKAGCKIFVQLITSTGVLKTYEDAFVNGFTLFAPTDEAFSATVMAKLKKLSSAQQIYVLEYHALPQYSPMGTLKTSSGPVSTLATSGAAKYALSISSSGNVVTLSSGLTKSTVTNTLDDDEPIALYTINKLLMPTEIFGVAPAPAPTPDLTPSSNPTPAEAPAPEAIPPSAPSPSPVLSSPPAPPTGVPAVAPAVMGPASAKSSTGFAPPRISLGLGFMASLALACSAILL
ncbi:hypothetical protein SUGI_0951780 [Cryptomeria japonica]|uniref:fasciclin-like arabinogalactan protein 8 n=1 Tax=Cryptomeria japonica TaxID=3369 RepID=UPI002414AE7E|nr:fasciclin-like arabinogalactan protein 8 [Cryptomeria japonica]GLJ45220.1 hypothetical protein SUGI_0951780 [Cryptomeria japonica]